MTHYVYDNVTGARVTRDFVILGEALDMCRTLNSAPGTGGRYKVTNCRFDNDTLTYVAIRAE